MTRLNEALGRYLWVPWLVIIIWVLSVAHMASDRKPPIEVMPIEPTEVAAGDTAIFAIPVRWDLTRRCESRFSRYLFDAAGTRFDLGSGYLTPIRIREIERATPGRLLVAIHIPAMMAPGPAILASEQAYACNKVHAIWPIQVSTQVHFTVR